MVETPPVASLASNVSVTAVVRVPVAPAAMVTVPLGAASAAWSAEIARPERVRLAVRAAPVLAAAVQVTEPESVPPAAERVSQLASEVTVQSQPEVVVTVMLPLAPVAAA